MSSENIECNKDSANPIEYYNLFKRHVSDFKDGERILFIHIGNFDVLNKFISSNPNCSYFIIDQRLNCPLFNAYWPEAKCYESNEDISIIKALESIDMKFDKIIMNPPYSENLHLKILAKAIEKLDEDGTCVNLSPIRWLQDPLAKYKKNSDYKRFEKSVAKHIESLDEVPSITASSIFTIKLTFLLGLYKCKKTDNLKQYLKFNENSILEKVVKKVKDHNLKQVEVVKSPEKYAIIMSLFAGGDGGRADAVRGIWPKQVNTDDYRKKNFFTNGKNLAGETLLQYKTRISAISHVKPKDEVLCVEFDSAAERQNFYDSYETIFLRYVFKSHLVDVHVHPEFLPWMGDCVNPRTGKKGYESEWTNEDFYEYFGITEDEQKLIEKTMEKYK